MEWVRGEILGHGSFATVNLAKPKKQSTQSPQLIAVKSCKTSHSSSLINEKLVLENLSDCPYIIQCLGSDFTLQNNEEIFNLLLEYASGGSLFDKIHRSGARKLPESDLKRYTKSILKGVFHIHDKGYVHCDIKPQNILLCSSGNSDIAKIGDFGLAKKAGVKRGKEKVELRGTPMYMSPEMAAAAEQEPPADIWALGCVLAEMAAGAPPWRFPAGDDVAQLLMRVGKSDEVPEIPDEISLDGRDFIGKCFIRDPSERWTAEMLLDHPFVSDDCVNVALDNCSFKACLDSPSCPFEFPDWYESSGEVTFLPSSGFDNVRILERIRHLANDHRPDWSVTERWVTVR